MLLFFQFDQYLNLSQDIGWKEVLLRHTENLRRSASGSRKLSRSGLFNMNDLDYGHDLRLYKISNKESCFVCWLYFKSRILESFDGEVVQRFDVALYRSEEEPDITGVKLPPNGETLIYDLQLSAGKTACIDDFSFGKSMRGHGIGRFVWSNVYEMLDESLVGRVRIEGKLSLKDSADPGNVRLRNSLWADLIGYVGDGDRESIFVPGDGNNKGKFEGRLRSVWKPEKSKIIAEEIFPHTPSPFPGL